MKKTKILLILATFIAVISLPSQSTAASGKDCARHLASRKKSPPADPWSGPYLEDALRSDPTPADPDGSGREPERAPSDYGGFGEGSAQNDRGGAP